MCYTHKLFSPKGLSMNYTVIATENHETLGAARESARLASIANPTHSYVVEESRHPLFEYIGGVCMETGDLTMH